MNRRSRVFLVVFYGVVVFAPLAWMALRAFRSGGLASLSHGGDQDLLANSIFLALLTTVFALLLGVPLGFLLGRRSFPGRRVVAGLVALPLLVPPHIHAISWARVTGDRGWLTAWLSESFGFKLNIRAPLGSAGDFILGNLYPGPAWVMACAFFPLVVFPLEAALAGLDPEGVAAAELFGGRRAAFRRVVLPSVGRALVAGATFVFLLALSTYPVVSLLDTPTLIQRVFFTFAQVDQSAGALLALPLVLVAAVTVFLLSSASRGLDVRQATTAPRSLRRASFGTLAASLGIVVLATGVPFASLLREAGPLRLGSAVPDNYQSVFGRVSVAFGHSLGIAAVSVLVLIALSWPIGQAFARARHALAESVGLSLLAFPPVVVGVALVMFWSTAASGEFDAGFVPLLAVALGAFAALGRGSLRARLAAFLATGAATFLVFLGLRATGLARLVYEEGLTMVVLALVVLVLPFTARILKNGFEAAEPDALDAARLTGASPVSCLFRIEVPRMLPFLSGAALVAWVLCFTELAATLMTLRPGWQSVQVRIFNMVHYQSIGEVAALCVLSVLAAALPIVVVRLAWPARGGRP